MVGDAERGRRKCGGASGRRVCRWGKERGPLQPLLRSLPREAAG